MTISKGKTGPKSATQGKNEEVKTEISNKNDKKKEEEDGVEEKKSNGVETKSPGDTKKNGESNNSKFRSGSDHRVPERKGRWHNTEEDMPVRRIMIGKIVSLLKEKKPVADESCKKKLPDMARRLEDSLYRGAPDKATYSDGATLKTRLQKVAMMMTKRKQATMHSNEPPKPVPISKIDDKVINNYLQNFRVRKKSNFQPYRRNNNKSILLKLFMHDTNKHGTVNNISEKKPFGTLQAKMAK